MHDGDSRPARRQRRGVQVVVGVVDDDQQVPQRIRGLTGERRAVGQRRSQHRDQLVGVCRQEAGRADAVELAGNVDVRQPLQPGPVRALQVAAASATPSTVGSCQVTA